MECALVSHSENECGLGEGISVREASSKKRKASNCKKRSKREGRIVH